MKSILILPSLLACTPIVSCSDSSTDPASETTLSALYPLTTGDTWVYAVRSFDPTTGEWIATDTSRMIVDSAITFRNAPAFAVHSDANDLIYFNEGHSLFTVHRGAADRYFVVTYPLRSGETVTGLDTLYADRGIRRRQMCTLISTSEAVTVPAGTFNSFHFETITTSSYGTSTDTLGRSEFFLCPGIGMIRSQSYNHSRMQGDILVYDAQLVRYQVK